jgi:hypothetical protein
MNTLEIEDRIRAAARAAGDTVAPASVPPLRLPSDGPFRARSGSFASVWGRWLAPVAAAAAVIVVAVAMVFVGRTVNHPPAGSGGVPSARPGPVRTGPPISSYVASGRVPRYYVSVESNGNPNFNPSYAVVRATATGAAMETVVPAGDGTVVAVTAAADDRTFVLDTQPWGAVNQSFAPRTFLLLRLGPDGGELSQSRLAVSVPGGQLMTGFALSPDGSKLAIAVQPDNDRREPDLTEVKVITLATGATQIWTADGTIGFGPDDARSLSWAGDERTLAFDWEGNGPGIHTGVWLLDVATGGGRLLADSREAVTLINGAEPVPSTAGAGSVQVTSIPASLQPATASVSASASGTTQSPSTTPASPATSASPATASASPSASAVAPSPSASPISLVPTATTPTCQEDSILTPDRATIVCGAITATKATGSPSASAAGPAAALLQRGAETEFIEYSAASGKVARVLGRWTFGSVGALSVEVLWSNASGSVLIGVIPDSGGGRVGVISGNEFTPLPGPEAASAAMQSGTW